MCHVFLITLWLLVQSAPAFTWEIHIANVKNGIAEFEEGKNAHLSCSASDLPTGIAPKIHWIDTDSQVIKSRVMSWREVSAKHEGRYKCVVDVDGEERKEVVELRVHSKFLSKYF